jgi:hypothetical protein
MNRTVFANAAGLAGAGLAVTSMSPAAADPKPINDSWQTSVCDNGETYGFPVVHVLHGPVPPTSSPRGSLRAPGHATSRARWPVR